VKRGVAPTPLADLAAVEAPIGPHFFCTCMSSIASLPRSNPALAERAVEDLADLFRASFADAQSPVPFADELDLVERYLSIEGLRLGERLKVEWRIADLPATACVPLLSLQPIVENAIYHGIEPARNGGCIEISASADQHNLVIEVANPLSKADEQHHQGNRIALENVRLRLNAHFGNRAELSSEQVDDLYRVRLRLPLSGNFAA